MVKDPNTQYLPCRHQSRGQETIFLARRRITTGMVVEEDHCRRGFFYCECKDFAWMDNAERQAAFRYSRVAHNGVLCIHQNDSEDVGTQLTQDRMVEGEEVPTGWDLASLGQSTRYSSFRYLRVRAK